MHFLQVESGEHIEYGLIQEFVGRFRILVNLSSLSEEHLVEVT
jgi:ATP-dependent protease Clp ATPase subunit